MTAAALAAGCGDRDEVAVAPPATGPVTVTREDAVLPAGCRPAEVATLVARRLEAHPRRLHLVEVAVGYANGLGQVELKAADPGGARAEGKGAVDCEARRIVAFGVGVIPSDQTTAPVCPVAPGGGPVACARDWG
jgi:hypothetical protein